MQGKDRTGNRMKVFVRSVILRGQFRKELHKQGTSQGYSPVYTEKPV
jgi:hypothetical protein